MELAPLLTAFGICFATAALGGALTRPAIAWYDRQTKPWLAPPNWAFGPAWTIFFTLMSLALYLVLSRGLGTPGVPLALAAFGVQLVLNVLWSYLFFTRRSPEAALKEVWIFWAAIALTIAAFLRVSVTAGLLLVPYLVWVTYAAILNAEFVKANR